MLRRAMGPRSNMPGTVRCCYAVVPRGAGLARHLQPGPGMKGDPGRSPIDPGVRIGHVHLKVSDLERSLEFYCGVLGFEVMARMGRDAAFIAAGGYHHHIGLNTWHSRGGRPPPENSTGLYHAAILYPTRAALADALRRLMAAGIS